MTTNARKNDMIDAIPLLDLEIQFDTVREDVLAAVERVFASQHFILGEEVERFEGEVARYHRCKHAIGLASGTDALTLSLRALDIGPGDEVIVPAFTFFATVESVLHVNATPVFVDVDEQSYCLNVDMVEALITEKTRAIIPVHLFGHPVQMNKLTRLAARNGLRIIEDNAQGFGARVDDKITGSIGDIGCLSFFPSKNLGACGDGGMVVTDDDHIAERLRMLRMHGWKKKNYPEVVGYNSRLDALQAAILSTKLPHVEHWNEQRRQSARIYNELLSGLSVRCPTEQAGTRHVFNLYVIGVNNRDAVQRYLKQMNVGNAVYYPAAIHTLTPCQRYAHAGQDFPVSEALAGEVLAIPMFPGISPQQQEYVVSALAHVCG